MYVSTFFLFWNFIFKISLTTKKHNVFRGISEMEKYLCNIPISIYNHFITLCFKFIFSIYQICLSQIFNFSTPIFFFLELGICWVNSFSSKVVVIKSQLGVAFMLVFRFIVDFFFEKCKYIMSHNLLYLSYEVFVCKRDVCVRIYTNNS